MVKREIRESKLGRSTLLLLSRPHLSPCPLSSALPPAAPHSFSVLGVWVPIHFLIMVVLWRCWQVNLLYRANTQDLPKYQHTFNISTNEAYDPCPGELDFCREQWLAKFSLFWTFPNMQNILCSNNLEEQVLLLLDFADHLIHCPPVWVFKGGLWYASFFLTLLIKKSFFPCFTY